MTRPKDLIAPGRIIAAQALVERAGGEQFVSPEIARIARLSLDDAVARWQKYGIGSPESIVSARAWIELNGGEANVPPEIVRVARMSLDDAIAHWHNEDVTATTS